MRITRLLKLSGRCTNDETIGASYTIQLARQTPSALLQAKAIAPTGSVQVRLQRPGERTQSAIIKKIKQLPEQAQIETCAGGNLQPLLKSLLPVYRR